MDFMQNLQPKGNRPTIEDQIQRDERPMEEIFNEELPDSLYMNHYDLHEAFPHHSAEAWRRYLKENDRFIMQETAAITEANARAALKQLSSGNIKQGDGAAIKQLLDRSEQINQSVKDKTVYMTTYLPDPAAPKQHVKGVAETVKENREIARIFYPRQVFQLRESRGELVENADGTLHFPMEDAITHLDKVYMRFHNPDNALINDLTDGDLEWQ